jgi:hypothetical protein
MIAFSRMMNKVIPIKVLVIMAVATVTLVVVGSAGLWHLVCHQRTSAPLTLIAISVVRTAVTAAFLYLYHPCSGPSVHSVGSMVQAWAQPPLLCGSVARSAPAWQPSETANTMRL